MTFTPEVPFPEITILESNKYEIGYSMYVGVLTN